MPGAGSALGSPRHGARKACSGGKSRAEEYQESQQHVHGPEGCTLLNAFVDVPTYILTPRRQPCRPINLGYSPRAGQQGG